MSDPTRGRLAGSRPLGGLLILALAAVLFLANLWGYDLWAPDEPYFGEGAREMIADGRWVVPHVNGVVTNHKPPLFFWLIALISLPLGQVYSLTARLPSALAALGTLYLTMRIGRRFCDDRTATLAGFVLATCFMFWEKARSAQIESTLCFLIWVALSAFVSFRKGEASGLAAGLVFWAAAALAVLAKGPVGLLLPLGIVASTLVADRNPGDLRRLAPLAGPLLFTVLVGAWVAAATLAGPEEYSVWGALREHFVSRGLHGMHHPRPWYFYLVVLPGQLLPWSGLVPGALVLAIRRRDECDRFLLSAALFVLAFFSLSAEKRELYALPAVPAFALMAARLAGAFLGWEHARVDDRWVRHGQRAVGALLVAVGLALPFVGRRVDEAPYWIALVLSALAIATGGATLVTVARRLARATVLAPATGFAAAYLVTALAIYPAMEPRKSARPLARSLIGVADAARAAGRPVMTWDLGNLPIALAFYSHGVYTVEARDLDELAAHLAGEEGTYAVIDARALDALPPAVRESTVVLARARLGREALLVGRRGSPPPAGHGSR